MFKVFLFLCSLSLFAQIQEISHFHEIEAYADSNTLVLVDIDDTLLVPAQMLGSDAWFEHRLGSYSKEYKFEVALEKTLAEWEAIRHLSQMELVEPEIRTVIASMQEKKIPIIGLTIQGLALATRTVLQLRDQNVDLSKTSPFNEDYCFSVEGHTVLYRQGILFTSGKSKGLSFFQLSERFGGAPKRLLAIDDKLKHLEHIEKEAKRLGIEFIGLRYSFSDTKKEAFSPEIADYQLKHSLLTHLLSDNEVKERLIKMQKEGSCKLSVEDL